MPNVLDKAIIFAVNAHSGDKRKGTAIPYIVHPAEVLAIVSTMTTDPYVLAAAVLHDVVEDTEFTIEDMVKEFGTQVAEYVQAESEDKRVHIAAEDSWKIRKLETLAALKQERIEVQMIALGDKLSNIRAINRDYAVLGDELWQRFNQKDKQEHAWYYKEIGKILELQLKQYPAYQEYQALVLEVFGQ